MCSCAHMDSRGNPARSHKSGIKTAGGRFEGLRAERANLSGADTPGFEAPADHMQALPDIANAPSCQRCQRVSAAAMNSPAPISKASAIPPTAERTRRRRLAGLVSAAVVCAATSAIQKLLMQLASGRPLRRLEGVSPAISGRDRAYSALRADSCPLDSPLRSARHSPQPHSPSQPQGRERVRALETSQIFHRAEIFHRA